MNGPVRQFRILLLSTALACCTACGESDSQSEPFDLSMPIAAASVTNIWPFGARGGDHPEGHPGIDFDAAAGTPILAAGDGTIFWIGDSVYPGEKSIVIHHGFGDTYYTTYFQAIAVATGQRVAAGQLIADLERWPGRSTGALHFGVGIAAKNVCPYDYLSAAAKAELDALLARASYPGKAKYPLICNYN